jgi:hypothetical protein
MSKRDLSDTVGRAIKKGLGLIMWEYKVIEMITLEPMAIERRLNELGRVNWELVSYFFSDSGSSGMAVFKRPGRKPDRRHTAPDRRKTAK